MTEITMVTTQAVLALFISLFVFQSPIYAQWVKTQPLGVDGTGPFDTLGNKLFASGGDGPPVWTSDLGETWHYAGNGLYPGVISGGIDAIAHIGSVMVVGTSYSGIFRSTDSGLSWSPCRNDSTGFHSNQTGWPAFFALTGHDGYLFAGSNGGGFYRSTDSGQNWEMDTIGLAQPYPNPELGTNWLLLGAYSFVANDSVLLAGSPEEYVYKTTNDGNTWDTSRLTPDQHVGDIVVALTIIGHIALAGTSGGLYRSTDLGVTWSHIDTSIFNYHSGVLSLLSVNGKVIAGAHGPIFISSDSGLTWEPFSQGLQNGSWPSYLAVFNGYLFAGLVDGVYRRPASDLAVVSSPQQPVNISLRTPLEIYDLLGRLVYEGPSSSKPILSQGFYFERSGGNVQKIWIP